MLKNRFLLLSISLFTLIFSAPSLSQALSEPAIFNRCYTQLTGQPVPLGHPVMAQVRAGAIDAQTACLQLIDKVEINASTGLLSDPNDLETKSILNNLYGFHRSWFPTNNVIQIQGYEKEVGNGTADVFDTTEPGLALTRAMFAKNAKYSDTLTLNTGVTAIREQNTFIQSLLNWKVSAPSRFQSGNVMTLDSNVFNFRGATGNFSTDGSMTSSTFVTMPLISTGQLVGIKPTTDVAMVPNVNMSPRNANTSAQGNAVAGLKYSFDVLKNWGGGILGSPVFFMLNNGHPAGQFFNGQTKVPRKWAKTAMESLLCANLPALREADIVQYLDPTSTAPFRTANSCLQCHANLDQMAYTMRNNVEVTSDVQMISSVAHLDSKVMYLVASFNPSLPSVAGWPSEPVTNFQKQMPSGRLLFRSFSNGQLVNKPVNNVGELGAAMAGTDDFYQCAAKRYFEFFTGIVVPLYDRQDPRYAENNKALSDNAIADRKFVEQLADNLKNSQSTKQLIKEIIKSNYYRSASFR